MKKIIYFIIFALCFSTMTGCDYYRKLLGKKTKKQIEAERLEAERKPVLNKVEDTQLAKLILTPKKYKLDLKVDPFEPIIEVDRPGQPQVTDYEPSINQVVRNIEFLGVVKVSSKYSALLKANEKKGVFNINDKIDELTVVDIQEEQVVLKNGTNTYILKRGEK